jgi:hypothetical protein
MKRNGLSMVFAMAGVLGGVTAGLAGVTACGATPDTRVIIYGDAGVATGIVPPGAVGSKPPGLPPGATAPPAVTGTIGVAPPVPVAGSGQNCMIDTHATIRYEGRLLETLTGGGKLFNFELNGVSWPGNGADLTTVPHYAAGPCAGVPAGTCRFDTRAFVNVNGQVLEYISAYGRNWTFDDGIATDSGSDLASSARYYEACAGRIGACKFDTRMFFYDQGRYIESITAYGRIFEYTFAGEGGEYPTALNGRDLTSIAYYAQGPCAGKGAGQCVFNGRTLLEYNGQTVEVITAYGMVWRFAGGVAVAPSGQPAYAQSPWNQGMCR